MEKKVLKRTGAKGTNREPVKNGVRSNKSRRKEESKEGKSLQERRYERYGNEE